MNMNDTAKILNEGFETRYNLLLQKYKSVSNNRSYTRIQSDKVKEFLNKNNVEYTYYVHVRGKYVGAMLINGPCDVIIVLGYDPIGELCQVSALPGPYTDEIINSYDEYLFSNMLTEKHAGECMSVDTFIALVVMLNPEEGFQNEQIKEIYAIFRE